MYTQPGYFRLLKDCSDKVDWLNYKLPKRDRPILPLLAAMNSHPGVATRWSCPGHPHGDPLVVDAKDFADTLHVISAVDESGMQALLRFYDAVGRWPDIQGLQIKLTVMQLQAIFYTEGVELDRVKALLNETARKQAEDYGLVDGRWNAFEFHLDYRFFEELPEWRYSGMANGLHKKQMGRVFDVDLRAEILERLTATWLEVNPV